MKKTKKIVSMIILTLLMLFIAFPKSEAINSNSLNQNEENYGYSSSEQKERIEEDNKPKCRYKEGEVIITYEQSFWNSKAKLSIDSSINKYSIDETIEFDDIIFNSDNTVNISNNNSSNSTLAVSLVKSDKHTTQELIKLFKDKEWVISVEPNYIIKTTSLTNDSYENHQWALENMGQNSGTKDLDINPISTSSEKEKVIAIIDSGVDYTHEDLKDVMWINPYSQKDLKGKYGFDFINNDDDPMDDNNHGTHVAGIIAADANNKTGVSGAILGASNIKIMALKTFDENGEIGDVFSAIEAYNYIYKAQQLGTNIVAVNNSWGGFIPTDDKNNQAYINSLEQVINLVGEKGALSICAAGNEKTDLGNNGVVELEVDIIDENGDYVIDKEGCIVTEYTTCKFFPACIDSNYIVSVAASNEKDELAFFSNYGKCIDIAAPGTGILSSVTTYVKDEQEYNNQVFTPSIYNEDEIKETCDEFWDFENCSINDVPFTPTYGKISITNEKSYGNGNKCLKWEFDIPDTVDIDNPIMPQLIFKKRYKWYGWISGMLYGDSNGNDISLSYGTVHKRIGNISYDDGGGSVFYYGQNYWVQFGRISGVAFSEAIIDPNLYEDLEENPFDGMEHSDELKLYNEIFNPGHYIYYIDDFAISKHKSKEEILKPYALYDGTSMAAPFVTGAVGTLSNLYENEDALQIKEKLLKCTRKTPNLKGKVVTGGVLDLSQLDKPTLEEPEPSEPIPEESSSYVPIQGISLDKTEVNLKIGEKVQLIPIFTPENVSNKTVSWFSFDNQVVSVNNGELEAKAEGNTEVMVISAGGEYIASCEVTVSKPLDISKCNIKGIVPTYYTGKKVKLDLSLSIGNNKLVENVDYKVSYKNNINVGDATVIINGIGSYTGKINKKFKIINKPNFNEKIDYYITSAFSKGRALDLKNGATNVGNNIQLKTLSCGTTQRYKIIKNKDDSYYIQNVKSKKYLGVNNKYTGKAKTKVVLAESNNNPGTKWYIGQNPDASISFYTKDGLVIEALENNNTNLQINVSNNSNLQKFIITRTDYINAASISTSKVYYIVSSINNKKAIDVYAAGTADFTNVDIYDLNKTNAQKFKFKKNSDGSYTIINKGSNKAIDVLENKTANMTNVDIYTLNNTTSQKWYAIKNLDGTISFLGAESGKALDLYAADTQNFSNINIWDWNQTKAQKWKLIN